MNIQDWIKEGKPLNSFINGDCMEGMKEIEDKYFDIAIVDPPYGKRPLRKDNGTYGSPGTRKFNNNDDKWDIKPNKEYFNELFRISKNQIIWGANYFIEYLFNTNCFIVWDKKTGDNFFSDCELAWTNFKGVVKKFELLWLGKHCHRIEQLIHPTQKPIQLYKWILKNYCKPGDKIIDTHVGSASSLIAFMDEGFEYLGFELDKDYYNDACKRIDEFRKQGKLLF